MTSLKAFIVEDSPVIRENLVAALEEMAPIEVIGTAEDEGHAVDWLEANECDLAVVDIFLKSGSGLGVLKAAVQAERPTKVVVLSNYATPDMRRKCLELGADRVFDKSNEIDALILYCCRLADGLGGGADKPPHEQLSEREFQVFLRLAKGETIGHMANSMSLSVKTVSTYRTRVMEKMKLESNSDLTYYALKNGLIQ